MSQYIQETTRTLVIAICCIKISRTEEIYFVVSAYDVEIRWYLLTIESNFLRFRWATSKKKRASISVFCTLPFDDLWLPEIYTSESELAIKVRSVMHDSSLLLISSTFPTDDVAHASIIMLLYDSLSYLYCILILNLYPEQIQFARKTNVDAVRNLQITRVTMLSYPLCCFSNLISWLT